MAGLPGGPGLYLDGEPPHHVFWELPLLSDADPEGPVGVLVRGPVVDTFLGGRVLGVRGGGGCQPGQGQGSRQGGGSPPIPPLFLPPSPAGETLTPVPQAASQGHESGLLGLPACVLGLQGVLSCPESGCVCVCVGGSAPTSLLSRS